MAKSWYSRSKDIEYKDGHTEKEYHLVFETTDKELAKRIEEIFHNIMDGIKPEDRCSECDAWNQYKNYPRQPEIIRCRDCKYWREHKYAKETKRYIPFCGFNAIYTKSDDFCSHAERRTDERTD